MAPVNLSWRRPDLPHSDEPAQNIPPELQLRRSILACLLWNDRFYEDGIVIAGRIRELVGKVPAEAVSRLAIEARETMKLRYPTLLLVREMARLKTHRHLVADTLTQVIQRPDDMAEFIAIYWNEGKQPLSAQVKKGLALAFTKFDERALSRYNRAAPIGLRDVLFLCHARPVDQVQADLWRRLANGDLFRPDRLEAALSPSATKREIWKKLLRENKLSCRTFLRNLRDMEDERVDEDLIRSALVRMKSKRALPLHFITALRYTPQWKPELEQAMIRSLREHPKLPGKTLLLVDVSVSMDAPLSRRSEARRNDAAYGLAIMLQEVAEALSIYSFSDHLVSVPDCSGFALCAAIHSSQPRSGTYLSRALETITEKYDRLIVITDEQSHDEVPNPQARGYLINVARRNSGVSYKSWTHIDGWSERIMEYIRAAEMFL